MVFFHDGAIKTNIDAHMTRVPTDVSSGTVIDAPGLGGPVTVDELAGKGSFGSVYRVHTDDGRPLALKVEMPSSAGRKSQVAYENRVYATLAKHDVECVPRVHGFHSSDEAGTMVLMDLLGKNLQEVLDDSPHKKLPLRFVCIIGVRILQRLRALQRVGFVHRDMKPQNLLLASTDEQSDVYLVDFGLAKKFANTTPDATRRRKGLTGTPRFASIRCHEGDDPSYHDDVESAFYILAYLFRGHLPWQNQRLPPGADPKCPSVKRRKHACILKIKRAVNSNELFREMTPEVADAFDSIRQQDRGQTPDYDELIRMFTRIYKKCRRMEKNLGT